MRDHLAHLLPDHVGDAGVARIGGVGFDVNVVTERTKRSVEKLDDAEAFVDGIEQGMIALFAEGEGFLAFSAFRVEGRLEVGVLLFERLRVTSQRFDLVFTHYCLPNWSPQRVGLVRMPRAVFMGLSRDCQARCRRLPELLRHLFATLADRRRHHKDQDQHGDDDEPETDRPRHEHGRVAARHQHGAPQVLLHHRPEHEAEQHGRRAEAELDPQKAEHAEQRRHVDFIRAVVDAVDADGRERHDGGEQRRYGTLSMLTHTPTSGRLSTTSIRLPIHMLAIRPQNSSGRCAITSGPGWMPWMVSAPSISAITPLTGRPSVSMGMNLHWASALLAASGPATPSIAPRPKRDGSSASFFSTR